MTSKREREREGEGEGEETQMNYATLIGCPPNGLQGFVFPRYTWLRESSKESGKG